MFKRLTVLLAALFLFVGMADAQASSVHFKTKGQPVYKDNGLTLSASGAIVGLGNGDVTVTLHAVGQPIATCTNPSGANQPPGQNPAEVELTGTQVIPSNLIKNGNVSFNVTTGAPQTPIPGAPDCPNSKWREDIIDVVFSSADLSISQGGAVVLTHSKTF